jgi:predicted PolB exonuclease-like 3'-5' exonuclease
MFPNIHQILFLDIETVPVVYRYDQLDEETRLLWDEKLRYTAESTGQSTGTLYEKAGVIAEFSKVVCISTGFLHLSENGPGLRLKSFSGHDEKNILAEFAAMLDEKFAGFHLCAHNGKEFDFPFLCRRMLLNGVKLPALLSIAGKKPWETPHLDTMELWKFGDRKNFTSLRLLAHLFGLPSPKDDISGRDVARVYWEEDGLERIEAYCRKDVATLAQLVLKWSGKSLVSPENIVLA